MDNLIRALNILRKYGNPDRPVHREHDTLLIMISPNIVSDDDKEELDNLGFFVGVEFPNCFTSFRYGSA